MNKIETHQFFCKINLKNVLFWYRDKPLVIQFTVKHEQNIDCGGGYVKLFDCKLNQADMHGDSPYNVMFGPDICGPGTKKVHVIFSHKGKNHLIKKVCVLIDTSVRIKYVVLGNWSGSWDPLFSNRFGNDI
jgi:calreticulin